MGDVIVKVSAVKGKVRWYGLEDGWFGGSIERLLEIGTGEDDEGAGKETLYGKRQITRDPDQFTGTCLALQLTQLEEVGYQAICGTIPSSPQARRRDSSALQDQLVFL